MSMFEEVVLGTHRLYAEYGLVLGKCEYPAPEERYVGVEVPAASGELDMTEALTGHIPYESRKVTMEFSAPKWSRALARTKYHEIVDTFQGRRLPCVCQRWGGGAITGRVHIKDVEIVRHVLTFTIELEHCDSYIVDETQEVALSPVESTTVRGTDADRLDNPGPGLVRLRCEYERHPYNNITQYAKNNVCTVAAYTDNLFDMTYYWFDEWASPDGKRFKPGTVCSMSGQSISMDALGKSWLQRLSLHLCRKNGVTNRIKPAFPFPPSASGMYLTVWLSGLVTAVDSSHGGNLWVRCGSSDRGYDTSKTPEGVLQNAFGLTAGTTYDNEPFTLAITPGTHRTDNFVQIDLGWVDMVNAGIRVSLTTEPPTSWEEADIAFATALMPKPFQLSVKSKTTSSGTEYTYQGDVLHAFRDRTLLDKYTRSAAYPYYAEPASAQQLKAASMWFAREAPKHLRVCPREEDGCPASNYMSISAEAKEITEVEVQFGSMGATPKITSASDVLVSIADSPWQLIRAGSNVPYPDVIYGTQTLRYVVLGDSAATLTFDRGRI